MPTATISPTFKVVIPKAIREKLSLVPGQKVQVLAHAGRIQLVPVQPAQKMRGFLRGIDANIDREDDRNL